MTEQEQLLATWCQRVWDLGKTDYSPAEEKRKATRRLKELGRDFTLDFRSSDRWLWVPGRRRKFYDAGQQTVKDYLVPGDLPYDPGDTWCGLHHRQEPYMWAWVEGVSDYSAKLNKFLYGPEENRSDDDIVNPALIGHLVERCIEGAGRGRFCGYRNARVLKEELRNGETSRNLSRWIDASLVLKGSRIIFTRSIVYGDGRSMPLKSLMRSGYVPLAYRKNVYKDTGVRPDNLGGIFMIRYDTPKGSADYFFDNIHFMTEFLRLPAMQHVLTSLRTSSRN